MFSYIIIDVSYAVSMFLLLTILLKYKRNRKTLPIAFGVSFIHYLIIELLCQLSLLGVDMQASFIIAGYYEMLGTFILLCIFVSGNVWRNYVLVIFGFAVSNALTGILISFNSNLAVVYAGYVVNEPLIIKDAMIIAVVMSISGLVTVVTMSKFIKKDYNGNGRVYMIFSLLYVVIGSIQLIYKQNTIIEAIKSGNAKEVSKILYVVMGVISLYIFGLLYFRYESKRISKENNKLAEIISNNNERYQKLVKDNSKMETVKKEFIDYYNQIKDEQQNEYKKELQSLARTIDNIALTGNIVIDALIKNSYDEASGEGIAYEIIPGNVEFKEEKIINYATIVENLLSVGNMCAKNAKDKWLYLSFLKNDNLVLIKAEFSKNIKTKLSLGENMFEKQTNEVQRIKLIKSLAEYMGGSIYIKNKEDESCINILVNNI